MARLGDILVGKGWITSGQLQSALASQGSEQGLLGMILVRRGLITADQLGEALSQQYGVPYLEIVPEGINPQVVRLIPEGDEPYVLQWKTAEDNVAVQPSVTLRIHLNQLDQLGAIFRRGVLEILNPEVDWVDLDELDAEGVVHPERGCKVGRDVAIVGALHSPVDFIKENDIRLPQQLRFAED